MAHKRIVSSVVGSTFYQGASNLLGRLRPGNPLNLQRQPQNKYDKNAIGVFFSSTQLGHLPRGLAAELAPLMDAGVPIKVCASAQAFVVQLEWDVPDVTEISDPTL